MLKKVFMPLIKHAKKNILAAYIYALCFISINTFSHIGKKECVDTCFYLNMYFNAVSSDKMYLKT